MAIEGVDYTTTDRPSIASLLANGKAFACRYGGPGGTWKQLTAAERDELHAAGIAIVANAEGTAGGLKGGRDAGVAWATSARDFWDLLGLPEDRPIYFSVDFDPSPSDWPALDAAMDGAASVLGRDRVGVYGGYEAVAHFAANKKATWYWQTYGWSGGRWHPAAHIRQYHNGVPLGGGTVDLNRAMVADYGQWTAQGDDMANTDGDIAEQYRLYSLLMLDPKWAADSRIVAEGRMAVVPFIDAFKAVRADVAELKARPAPTATVDPAVLEAAVEKALDARADALADRVADKLAKRLES